MYSYNGNILDMAYAKNGNAVDTVYGYSGTVIDSPSYIIDVSAVASYFQEETRQAAAYAAENSEWIHHIVVTDQHYNSNKKHSFAIVKALYDTGIFGYVMNLGDNTQYNSTGEFDSYSADWGQLNGHTLAVLGNHDWDLSSYQYGTGGASSERDAQIDALMSACTAAVHDDSNANWYKHYYYVDDATNKIRYLFLNTNRLTADSAQASFLSSHVHELSADWLCLILGHHHLQRSDVSWSTESLSNIIVNAVSGCACNLLGYVHGHLHWDDAYTYNGINALSLCCDKFDSESTNAKSPAWTANTAMEQAVTILSINPASGAIKVRRIGAYKNGCLFTNTSKVYVWDRT